jgi:hypothetical protein
MKHSGLKFVPGLFVAGALGVVALTNGCSAASSLQNAVCCKEYAAGTDMSKVDFGVDASISGQFYAFAQATGDMSVVANGAVDDVTAACRQMAIDLGNDPNDMGAQGKAGTDLLSFWCGAASAKIDATFTATGTASASLKIDFQPPQCTASLSAQAACQGHCDVSGMCDIKANPPKCMGGTLDVECSGACMAMAGASIDCTGSCMGNCSGSCSGTVMAPIDCNGSCDGTCAAKAGVGNGMGANADGTCQGTCSGKCTMAANAKVSCSGTCSGQCDATCAPPMGMASVKCSGQCMASATPISCTGGTLSGGCMVSADCQANCNASVSARAECTPPALKITTTATVSASASAQFNTLIDTLETNLPKLVLVVKARGQAFLDQITAVGSAGATITASGKLDAHGGICAALIASDAVAAAANFTGALSASVSVTGKVGM